MAALLWFCALVGVLVVSKYFERRLKAAELLLTDEQRFGGSIISRSAALSFLVPTIGGCALANWFLHDWALRFGAQIVAMMFGFGGIAYICLRSMRRRNFPAELIKVSEQLALMAVMGAPLLLASAAINK